MDYADLLICCLLGSFCGAACAFTVLCVEKLFWALAALTAAFLGVLIATLPLATQIWGSLAFVACFFIGFLLLARFFRDDGWRRGDGDGGDDEPPWWPQFEDQFRRYSRAARRPKTPAGMR